MSKPEMPPSYDSSMPPKPVAVTMQPVTGGVVRLPDRFESHPMRMVCNVCRADITTKTEESCNPICCVVFGVWALCMCQDVEHKCPNCNAVLGKHSGADC